MNEPRDCHTEWSQTEDKYHEITYILKNNTNKFIYKTEIDSQM